MKGLRNKEVKKSILKEVKAKDSLIDMDVIEQAINVQASVQAFDNFGINPSAPSSCNKMQDSNSSDQRKGKGKGKGKGKNGNSDKKDQGPQYSSEAMASFCKEWNVVQEFSSPGYPRANVLSENHKTGQILTYKV